MECNGFCCCCHGVCPFDRSILEKMNFFLPLFSSRLATISIKTSSSFDLRTLRAVRVLRPLKLVSGIPSKTDKDQPLCTCSCSSRSPSGAEIDLESDGSSLSNRSVGSLCHHYLRDNWSRIIFGCISYHMFLCKSNRSVK